MNTEEEFDFLKPEEIPAKTLLELARIHIRRFSNLLHSGSSNVRIGECEHYLSIWGGVKQKAYVADNQNIPMEALDKYELQEINNAIYCGEYDDLLGIKHD